MATRKATRRAVQVDAQSSQVLGEKTAQGLTAAARQQVQFGEAVDQAHPSERGLLANLFGLDRADHQAQ